MRIKLLGRLFLAAVSALLLFTSVVASAPHNQDDGTQGIKIDARTSVYVTLLSRRDVRQELHINEAQFTEVTMTVGIFMNTEGAPDSAEKAWQSDARLIEQLKGALTDEQIARLTQLVIQDLHYEALYSCEIQKQVGLSSNQCAGVYGILDDTMSARERTLRQCSIEKERKAKLRQLDDLANAQIFAMLTPEQRTRLQSLCGPPFKPGKP